MARYSLFVLKVPLNTNKLYAVMMLRLWVSFYRL